MLDTEIRTLERSGDTLALRHARHASADEIARCHEEAVVEASFRAMPLLDLESLALAEIKARNPRSRLIGIIRYTKNTGATKIRACALCGWSERFAGGWRRTDASIRREGEHRSECLVAFRGKLIERALRK